MSEAIAFDTHRFVKHLTENGFTEQQAEVLADEQVHLLNSNLATQADVAAIHQDIDALRQETQANIAGVRQEIDALRQETKANIEALRSGDQGQSRRGQIRPDQVDGGGADCPGWGGCGPAQIATGLRPTEARLPSPHPIPSRGGELSHSICRGGFLQARPSRTTCPPLS